MRRYRLARPLRRRLCARVVATGDWGAVAARVPAWRALALRRAPTAAREPSVEATTAWRRVARPPRRLSPRVRVGATLASSSEDCAPSSEGGRLAVRRRLCERRGGESTSDVTAAAAALARVPRRGERRMPALEESWVARPRLRLVGVDGAARREAVWHGSRWRLVAATHT